MRLYTDQKTLLNAATSSGVDSYDNVKDYRHIAIEVVMTNFTGTVKFPVSLSDDAPSFGSAQASDNRWDYVQIKDLEDNSAINGDTGITGSGTTDVRIFEANANAIKWISANITSYTGGSITVRITPFND